MVLYHYTSQQGLIGITNTGNLWATHCNYLNDATEFLHALTSALDAVSNFLHDDEYLQPLVWELRNSLNKLGAGPIYVASFSAAPDLLSQWRGYCPGGAGACLGFDFERLREFCDNNGYRLERCIYDRQQLMLKVNELIHGFLLRAPLPDISREKYVELSTAERINIGFAYEEELRHGAKKIPATEAISWMCEQILELAPLYKNDGFMEEAEWRIIATHIHQPILFRPARSHLCPYIELPVLKNNKSILTEVILGPTPNKERFETSVALLLMVTGFGKVGLGSSRLPLISW